MHDASPQGRDERTTVVGYKPEQNRITDRFAGGKEAPAGHRGSAVRAEPRDDEPPPPPPVLRRVLKDVPGVSFKLPGSGSFRGRLKAGKVLSSHHYDLADLKAQGVLLGAVEDEVLGVPSLVGAASAQVQLKDMLAALASIGLQVVPVAAAPAGSVASEEYERLKNELAELRASKASEDSPAARKAR